MGYQCNDCSYQQTGPFPSGACPACGSYNVHRQQSSSLDKGEKGGKRWRLLVSIALWILLAYLVYRKF